MTELIWDGKYKDGKKQGPIALDSKYRLNLTMIKLASRVKQRQQATSSEETRRGPAW